MAQSEPGLRLGFAFAVCCAVLVGSVTEVAFAERGHDVVPSEPVSLKPSPLAALVAQLHNATPDALTDFARVAIRVMRDTYVDELQKSAAVMPAEPHARRKLARWRAATWGFVAELDDLIRMIDAQGHVEISVDPRDRVQILVNHRSVLISSPRIRESDQLAEQIVATYCWDHSCGTRPQPQPKRKSRKQQVPGTWSIGQGLRASFVTRDGLIFEFGNLQERAEKEQACIVAVRELRSLATNLREAHRTGYMIEWDAVQLVSADANDAQQFIINRRGQYLQLRLPSLVRSPALWREAVPWLRAQVRGAPYEQRFAAALVLTAGSTQRE